MRIYILITILLLAGSAQAATLTVCSSGCDYKSIQNASYGAISNDTILINSGTYFESVFLTKPVSFIGVDTGSGEPGVQGDLFTNGYDYSLNGFSFRSIQSFPNSELTQPGEAIYWIGQGDELQSIKSYKEALNCYENALELDPSLVVAWNRKGMVLTFQSRYVEAIKAFNIAIDLDSNWGALWINKGYTLFAQDKYDDAIKCYDTAIDLDPSDETAWDFKGRALYGQGKYDDAIKCYDKAIDLNQLDATDEWSNKGVALFAQTKYDEAVKCFDRAIDLDPSYAIAWTNLGKTLKKLGRDEEADAALTKAKELGYTG